MPVETLTTDQHQPAVVRALAAERSAQLPAPRAGRQERVTTQARIDRVASAVIFAALLALIVDMFLAWVRVTVYSAGLFRTPLTFDMQVTGSGWAGWGVVGGMLAVVLVIWHVWSLRRRGVSVGAAAITFALAAVTAGFTIWQALTGEVNVVSAEGTLFVTVTRLWPAKAAICLTAAVAAAAMTRLVIAALPSLRASALPERLRPDVRDTSDSSGSARSD